MRRPKFSVRPLQRNYPPGEERRRRADRVANGVPMAAELVAQLDRPAMKLQPAPPRAR
jgi:hypothetical protein